MSEKLPRLSSPLERKVCIVKGNFSCNGNIYFLYIGVAEKGGRQLGLLGVGWGSYSLRKGFAPSRSEFFL